MKNSNQKLGFFAYNKGLSAENIAVNYLEKHQWHIIHRRFHSPFGEIDLIAEKKNWLLFVEVKARKKMNDALFAISQKQQQRLLNAASYYLEFYQPQIEHFENIILTES